jgi:Protein of unknown function (DUF3443)
MNLRGTPIADVARLGCVVLLSAGLLLMIGCGGSSSGSSGGGTTITVSVSPATVTDVTPGAQTQYTATVSGTSNTAVTWQVNGVTGGSSTVGTISSSGDYTAPATVPSSSVTVTAVSQADSAVSGSATVAFQVNNTQALQVNLGPGNNYGVNGLFTDVTICVPGTSSCQDIPDVLVDTGSYGLRLLSSQVTLTLPVTTGSAGGTLQECIAFADGSYTWGPVATADIQMAGEKASAVPIQVISAADAFPAPSSCTSSGTGTPANTVASLGANGILGIGPFQQDCGTACTGSSPAAQYYLCPSSGCVVAGVALTSQLQNPVWLFQQDNNGVLISLPAVPAGGAPTVSGSLVFGIGTQSDNALGSAQLYTADGCGNISTTFNGTTYSDSSTSCSGGTYFDTGSQGMYILDSAALNNIPECSDAPPFYCPAATVNFTATNTGNNGTSAQVSFSVANADAIFSSSNAAFNNLVGANVGDTGSFDWGLPFFLGRNVFVGIQGLNSPTGVAGPYWAF